ncbi:bifunctional demethylmenaquinone methyltransferase/2-methoxy-6-polyprenyl-1,4-benzoquinol methylase UbiE [Thiotrichales bacterium 19S11-10]|nr:bifunctional demethylmenaquinone methyltransferase/2-methoxy-6-polyprenyl-1,4-benzoquinol methylase UbiE [Thiotrichales bacterium 19S11-10]MCF6808147.1 bifunctional demethylmenaquinone methyltransferase/2-methoxy-6-polyprenyl-1,4-benzoquinol methylase UbiE [Thiotrichales bacterium 19S9-11]MCF6812163.1 bifunctional demethylmenaquinone methyltransferase/2-methoxy-6-polyprenyl-1,4-benzoquinol methylase UbiE [Thiotrichales bacterium 19S9-12]
MSTIDKEKIKTTDFGFEEVKWEDKQQKVNQVFHSVASKYDLMNDVMSLGIHRYWKYITIKKSQAKPGDTILDLAGGTGDLANKFSEIVSDNGLVILSDINHSMLSVGKEKLINKGRINNLQYVQANAEALPFADNTFNCITISFGLRNVRDKEKALRSMYRVLKPGGKLLILEFSKPILPILNDIYDKYSFNILPWLGKIIVNDKESYRYLAESIRKHPDQETLCEITKSCGFDEVEYQNLSGGIVALHQARKY